MLLLGIDLGSSAVKASLVDASTGRVVASAQSPKEEMPMISAQPGWAEQDPAVWWQHTVNAVREALSKTEASRVKAIGIAYQMHGLVVVDKFQQVLRPSIIWCDSRAVKIGADAFEAIGRDKCWRQMLNSPGNFTASKLRWVQQNEPELYGRIHKIMLPGDYLAMRLTGRISTTASGLSEGMLWDFSGNRPAELVLKHFGFDAGLLPEVLPTFAPQGSVLAGVATELGLPANIPVAYRAGDQPNNAFSLRVLEPGELATTAGTSGVVYGVSDRLVHDPESRVNTFAHVNHQPSAPRLGVLLCINGTGILYAWLRKNLGARLSYEELNALASPIGVGSDGLSVLPFGNGAERMLGNRQTGARWSGLDFNRHQLGHLIRAAQEGIVFAFKHGLEGLRACGITPRRMRAGQANLFLSPIFRETLATSLGVTVELVNTDGATGAARGAGVGAGIFGINDAFRSLDTLATIEPNPALRSACDDAYGRWHVELKRALAS